MKNLHVLQENIYITSDEEIKKGDYMFDVSEMTVYKCIGQGVSGYKIILTTDQDLIKDGVQAIDDEFLEWFVKNPSCEDVKVEKKFKANPKYKEGTQLTEKVGYWKCKIIIPKEEPDYTALLKPVGTKQETLEEAFNKIVDSSDYVLFDYASFEEGAKWQMERSYSEKEVVELLQWLTDDNSIYSIMYGHKKYRFSTNDKDFTSKEILKQFKNK
jgi:hypothetical protein